MDQKVQQYDIPPPNYSLREHVTNGYSHRPSPAQVTSYIVIIYTTTIYFSCLMSIRRLPALLACFSLSLLAMIVSTAASTLTDPTDRVVYYYKWSRHDKKVEFSPEYDKVLFCQFCDSYCRSNAKHCRTCNRCVDKFDHHCMWFNNCVGERNYVSFFISIVSTFSYAVVVVIQVAICSFEVDFGQRAQVVMIVLGWLAGLLMVVFGFLLFNLIALHIYLKVNGLTTYQFLQLRKKQEQEQRKSKQKTKKVSIELQASIRITNNKVMPELNIIQPNDSSANLGQIGATKVQPKAVIEPEEEEIGTGRAKSKEHHHAEADKEKGLIFKELTVKSSSSKGNKEAEISEEMRSEHDQNKRRLSEDYFPTFFRENRSLRLLLSSAKAQSPVKHKQQRVPTFEL